MLLWLQCDQFTTTGINNHPEPPHTPFNNPVLRVGAMEASLEDITEAPDVSVGAMEPPREDNTEAHNVSRVGAIEAQCEDITESHEGLHAIINAPLSMPQTTSSPSHRHRPGGSSQDKTSKRKYRVLKRMKKIVSDVCYTIAIASFPMFLLLVSIGVII